MSIHSRAKAIAKIAYERRYPHFFEGTSRKNQEDWTAEVLLILSAAAEADAANFEQVQS